MKETTKQKIAVKYASTWTCLVANKTLSKEEADRLENDYKSGEGRIFLEKLLYQLKTDFEFGLFTYEGNFHETPFDENRRIDVTSHFFNSYFPYVDIKSKPNFRDYYLRLRLGRLEDKQLNHAHIKKTWIRPFMCISRNAKVTVSSFIEFDGLEVDNVQEVRREVANIEKEIAVKVFNTIYKEKGGLDFEIDKFLNMVIYETPEFSKIDILPLQAITEILNETSEEDFKIRLLRDLKKKASDEYENYLTLMEGPDKRKEAIIYFLPDPEPTKKCLIATYQDDTSCGLASSLPWNACMRNLVNNTLAMD